MKKTNTFSLSIAIFSSRYIYEYEHFNGIAELLEILGRYPSESFDYKNRMQFVLSLALSMALQCH